MSKRGSLDDRSKEDVLFRLTPVQESDYAVLYQWFSDPTELHLWSRIRKLVSFGEFVGDMKRRTEWGVVAIGRGGKTETPLALCELYDFSIADGTSSSLVYLAKQQRNMGFGILAVVEFFLYAFMAYPLRKIYGDTYEFNQRATVLVLGGGFRELGRFKKHIWWRDRYWDHIKYDMPRERFEEIVQLLLGSWSLGKGQPPQGFTQGHGQRLLLDLITLPFESGESGLGHDEEGEARGSLQEVAAMKRYLLSLAILVGGFTWIVMGAPVWSGVSLLEESEPAPLTTPSPTESPEKDLAVKQLLSQNDAVEAILAGREEGRDYWIRIDYVYEYMEARNTGEKPIAMVNIYFDPPVSFAGNVPTASDPCKGHRGADERLDPNDPCINEAPTYSTVHREFKESRGIVAKIDLRLGEVVDVFELGPAPYEIEDAKRGYAK